MFFHKCGITGIHAPASHLLASFLNFGVHEHERGYAGVLAFYFGHSRCLYIVDDHARRDILRAPEIPV